MLKGSLLGKRERAVLDGWHADVSRGPADWMGAARIGAGHPRTTRIGAGARRVPTDRKLVARAPELRVKRSEGAEGYSADCWEIKPPNSSRMQQWKSEYVSHIPRGQEEANTSYARKEDANIQRSSDVPIKCTYGALRIGWVARGWWDRMNSTRRWHAAGKMGVQIRAAPWNRMGATRI